METTPPLDRFDEAYRSRSAPWVIGLPAGTLVDEPAWLARARRV